MEYYAFSEHAKLRMKERGYTENDVLLAISHGKSVLQPEGIYTYKVSPEVLRNVTDRELQRNLKKINNTKVVVNPQKKVIVTVMDYVRKSWVEKEQDRFIIKWNGYGEFEEEERYLFGGILYCLLEGSLKTRYIQQKHNKFYLHREVVHDGYKLFRKDLPQENYGLQEIRDFYKSWLKFNKRCPLWSSSLNQLEEFLDEIREVKELLKSEKVTA